MTGSALAIQPARHELKRQLNTDSQVITSWLWGRAESTRRAYECPHLGCHDEHHATQLTQEARNIMVSAQLRIQFQSAWNPATHGDRASRFLCGGMEWAFWRSARMNA